MSENVDDFSGEYIIIVRPRWGFYCLARDGIVITAADSYEKIYAVYKALMFSEKLNTLAERISKDYQ